MIKNQEKDRMHGAIWLWCMENKYEEIATCGSCDATFQKEGKAVGFIYEFDKSVEELLSCINAVRDNIDHIYIVIDDISKHQSLEKIIPQNCGIFCNSNPFGLGMVTQIIREATNN